MIFFTLLLTQLLVGALNALILQFLWNIVAVDLFAAPELTFWYAWGILIMSCMLTASPTVRKDPS